MKSFTIFCHTRTNEKWPKMSKTLTELRKRNITNRNFDVARKIIQVVTHCRRCYIAFDTRAV